MRCTYCGNDLERNANFCNSCGKPVVIKDEEMADEKVKKKEKKPDENISFTELMGILVTLLGVAAMAFFLIKMLADMITMPYVNYIFPLQEESGEAANFKGFAFSVFFVILGTIIWIGSANERRSK